MSRSYKKVPGANCELPNHIKFAKRQANKKVRRSKDLSGGGGSYRKVYEQYKIRDQVCCFFSERELEEYFGDKSYKMRIK